MISPREKEEKDEEGNETKKGKKPTYAYAL